MPHLHHLAGTPTLQLVRVTTPVDASIKRDWPPEGSQTDEHVDGSRFGQVNGLYSKR